MSSGPLSQLTYKDAGVDLELYRQAMAKLPGLMRQTHGPRVIDLPGGFAGLFRLNEPRPGARKYRDPVLVSGTDGVGTKLKVAQLAGRYGTVGIDLVAMSVNDCLCLGAEPLFFLDYLALGRDNPALIAELVAGVCEGCRRAGAALLGGETAIRPAVYAADDFDLAGFCVGVVERAAIVDGSAIRPRDVVLGVASSGFHSNGYSLIRKAVFERAELPPSHAVPALGRTVAEALLEPTQIYVAPVLEALREPRLRRAVHGMAHITGGGLAENIQRILPEQCRAVLDRTAWPAPPLFSWLAEMGNIPREEMFQVFNMGIGYALVIPRRAIAGVQEILTRHALASYVIGRIEAAPRGAEYIN